MCFSSNRDLGVRPARTRIQPQTGPAACTIVPPATRAKYRRRLPDVPGYDVDGDVAREQLLLIFQLSRLGDLG
jgi:hypothetical protein